MFGSRVFKVLVYRAIIVAELFANVSGESTVAIDSLVVRTQAGLSLPTGQFKHDWAELWLQ